MHYNNDPDPRTHGYADDAAYAWMAARNHLSHRDTESWSAAAVLQATIDGARDAVVIRRQQVHHARNAVVIRRLAIVGLLVMVAIMCAVGADAAIRAGVGNLNAPAIVHVAHPCEWIYVRKC